MLSAYGQQILNIFATFFFHLSQQSVKWTPAQMLSKFQIMWNLNSARNSANLNRNIMYYNLHLYHEKTPCATLQKAGTMACILYHAPSKSNIVKEPQTKWYQHTHISILRLQSISLFSFQHLLFLFSETLW